MQTSELTGSYKSNGEAIPSVSFSLLSSHTLSRHVCAAVPAGAGHRLGLFLKYFNYSKQNAFILKHLDF